ncbi:CTP synthase [Candidatus Uhrbacteria bacterium]|nr:CTP synthase [Candidatus Uhrbacteria bacterium]
MRHKYVFVIGGVMSSVGKGVTSASIAKLMQARGYKVTNIKCDMYINIDAGTIRPTEHGEVFVGEDGIEADQDLGNYERYTGNAMKAENYITTGQVYQEVIRKERNLEYAGEDVEVVPDIPNEIIRRIQAAAKKDQAEITVVEFGGTVGEYQVLLFLEAARMMKRAHPKDIAFVLVSYLPVPSHIGEMKTKPTQHASRTLNEAGIQADFIVARGPHMLDKPRCDRLSVFCNVDEGHALSAPDVETIYEVPLVLENQEFSKKMLQRLNLKPKKKDLEEWGKFVKKIKSLRRELNIGIVGKYFGTGDFTLSDSYISVIESIKHACWSQGVKPKLTWINSETFEKNPSQLKTLSSYDGIIVPGGFGERGVEGIIAAIQYVRENKIPYFGLCYGMQLACIEFARHVVGLKEAHTTEINPKIKVPIIYLNPLQARNVVEKKYGATMRLGAYACELVSGTKARKAYGKQMISERHRHRYEFNNAYLETLRDAGLVISGVNPQQHLIEIIELKNHPFFVGVQFHPEFQSRPLDPHPLFLAFVKASMK